MERSLTPPIDQSDPRSMKTFSLAGSAGLVTGSSKGIGLAIAHGLREAGAEVVFQFKEPGLGEGITFDESTIGIEFPAGELTGIGIFPDEFGLSA